jgi:hypothetical protein
MSNSSPETRRAGWTGTLSAIARGVGFYLVGVILCVLLTPVETDLVGRQIWPYLAAFAPVGYILFYLDLTPQYVFGSTPLYWGVYALGIAPVLLGLASFFVGKARLGPWRPLLIGLPLGFVGTLGVYYTIAASI